MPFALPVRVVSLFVLHWPEPPEVLPLAPAWAGEVAQQQRLPQCPPERQPLSGDALALTRAPCERLRASGQRLAAEFRHDGHWIWQQQPSA